MSNSEKKPARPPPPATPVPSQGDIVQKSDKSSYEYPSMPSRPNPKPDSPHNP